MKIILFALVAACFLSVAVATAPLHAMESDSRIPDQYIVVFHRSSTVSIRNKHVEELTARFTGAERIINKFDVGTVIGYSAVLSKDTLASELEHPNVRYIEANQEAHLVADATVTQQNATWGISRVSQPGPLPLNNYYKYYASAGEGTCAYVIDTGIYIEHDEFVGGRAVWGVNTVPGEGFEDGNGHGTHVASTIGGAVYGIAKKVLLIAVKVLSAGGSGSWAGVIEGVDWALKDFIARAKALAVANMSLGGGITIALDEIIAEAIQHGLHFAIAAGNSNADACNSSPARVPGAITVGATTNTDARAYFSNYGRCVDIFGPGYGIYGAGIGLPNAIAILSGTSMAAPHVAGVVVVHLAHLNVTGQPIPTPSALIEYLIEVANKNLITDAGPNSPNFLLFSPSSGN